MLICDHYIPPDPYNPIVEGHLRETGFYHVSQIGVVQCQSALINALIERWWPETHTFHFPIGEYSVTLEDVAVIFGLSTNGIPVTGPTLSSYEALEVECLHHFGVAPRKTECRGSFVKLTWFRRLKDHIVLDNDIQIQRIREFSWGLACLAHLYRALCRATRVDCKEIDGPLTLLLTWAWIRLPFFSPIPSSALNKYHTLAHYRRVLDDLQEGQFVWEAYAADRIEAGVIPADIRHHLVIWSAIVPLISFECIEWHAFDRLRRQFGLSQGVPHQERDLGHAHGEGAYGAHLQLTDLAIQENQEGHPADHQENQQQQTEPPPPLPPPPPPPVSQPETQEAPQSYIPQTQPVDYFTPSVPLHQQYWGRMSLDSRARHHTSSSHSGGRHSIDSSRSDAAIGGIIQSGNPRRIPMSLIQESNKAAADEADDYLVDRVDEDEDDDDDEDEDEDEDEEDNVDDTNDDDDSHGDDPAPSAGTATSEKGKGYDLMTDPPRRSANRYTPSAFKRVAKKCKKFCNKMKWGRRK
ncbi:uncharacterized protein DS421_17g584360 [Arachis hypogaea]|nr:uncharacterized protein DS421_17g584360 [Arachis hypogaea]